MEAHALGVAAPPPCGACHLRDKLHLLLPQVLLRLPLDVLKGEPVGSVPLAVQVLGREGVEEHVAEVAVAPGAIDLQGAGAIGTRADVATHLLARVAAVEHRPPARRLELRVRRIERQAASAACKVALLWQELVVLAAPRGLGAAPPEDAVGATKLLPPLFLALRHRSRGKDTLQLLALARRGTCDQFGKLAALGEVRRVGAPADALAANKDARHGAGAGQRLHVVLDLGRLLRFEPVELHDCGVAARLLQGLLRLRAERASGF
mmetsp:Transcript_31206/g.85586  ORF Transcript_31206/g.85586 Transcript_31206/m.85586 type:complete len:264 (-) Transcript_31206:473-1264(-)